MVGGANAVIEYASAPPCCGFWAAAQLGRWRSLRNCKMETAVARDSLARIGLGGFGCASYTDRSLFDVRRWGAFDSGRSSDEWRGSGPPIQSGPPVPRQVSPRRLALMERRTD